MGELTPEMRAALPVAHEALESRESAYGIADSIVGALARAGLLRVKPVGEPPTALAPERLAGIEAREKAAFAGPWFAITERCADDSDEVVVGVATSDDTFVVSIEGEAEMALEDAAFVAHARADVPALLAEVARLREERDRFADRVDALTGVAKGNQTHAASLLTTLLAAEKRLDELEPKTDKTAIPGGKS